MKRLSIALCLAGAFALGGCGGGADKKAEKPTPVEPDGADEPDDTDSEPLDTGTLPSGDDFGDDELPNPCKGN